MGLLDYFTRPLRVTEQTAAGAQWIPPVSPIAGAGSSMARVAWSEFFAGEIGEVSREAAMQIPAVKRARDVLVGSIAGMPLTEIREGVDVTPRWLKNTRTGVSGWHRMAMTLDDLIFYDWSLWLLQRGTDGKILDALRVPFDRWQVDDLTGRITIDQKTISAEEALLIPGTGSGGFLVAGASTIRGYRAMERAWVGRVQNPIPLVELHQETEDPLTDGTDPEEEEDEIQRLVDEWSAARTSPTGAVGFTPHNVTLKVHGDVKHELFVEGRNAAVLDVARLLTIPAVLLDGSYSTASLTYSTVEGQRSEFDQYTIPAWTAPIEARLSLDDIAPAGHVIRFDHNARRAVHDAALPLED